jgi:YidC/Oxa1 family membrane protein insertase
VGEIGNFFFTVFTQPLFNGLIAFYDLFGDFALAIIVLTLAIKLILFPLTLQQLRSMKANQALQPHMADIKKKHANDKQAQALATQALYKEYGINPLGGCLPMLLQLPILYGLYYALSSVLSSAKNVGDINGKLYAFVPHLSSFSPENLILNWFTPIGNLFGQNWAISLAHGDPTHILPILAAAATFMQIRMSQPKQATKPASDDPNAMTMRMMTYFMPLMTLWIGWSFPAGLALYWTISALFQCVQQFFVTGWGALLTVPTFKKELPPTETATQNANASSNGNSKSYEGDKKAEGQIAAQAQGAGNGAISSHLRNTSSNQQYKKNRPKSGGSASARRRNSKSR